MDVSKMVDVEGRSLMWPPLWQKPADWNDWYRWYLCQFLWPGILPLSSHPDLPPGLQDDAEGVALLPATAQIDSSDLVAPVIISARPEGSVPRAIAGAHVETLPTGDQQVSWTVNAKVLDTSDKSAVSPEFFINVPGISTCPFRMVLIPRARGERRGAGSFKKAKGHGRIELKCEGKLPEHAPTFRVFLWIGGKRARGPVEQNFAQQSVCGLPRDDDDWDFLAAAHDFRTFNVHALVSGTSA